MNVQESVSTCCNKETNQHSRTGLSWQIFFSLEQVSGHHRLLAWSLFCCWINMWQMLMVYDSTYGSGNSIQVWNQHFAVISEARHKLHQRGRYPPHSRKRVGAGPDRHVVVFNTPWRSDWNKPYHLWFCIASTQLKSDNRSLISTNHVNGVNESWVSGKTSYWNDGGKFPSGTHRIACNK
jgi:hypothetical protein